MWLLGSIYGLQTYKSKDVNFWNGIYWGDINSQNNLQVIYMRGGFNWVFFILFLPDTLSVWGSWRSVTFDEEIIDITRKFVNLRYQLLPYLYTMFWQYIEEGIPMLKPLVYYDQSDIQTHYRNDEFIFGNQILVCPILEPNAIGRRMFLVDNGIITGQMIL
jgi:hypothetical protein